MFFRMVRGALFRQKGKMFMIAFTIALGVSLATAMMNVMLGVGDKVNKELKTYGANINVLHKDASLLDDLYGLDEGEGINDKFLKEDEIVSIKNIFWGFNIVDFTPYLNRTVSISNFDNKDAKITGTWFNKYVKLETGEEFTTGLINLKSWWSMEGEWLDDDDLDGVLVGKLLSEKNNIAVSDTINLKIGDTNKDFKVKGIFDSGGDEDEGIYASLKTVQALTGLDNMVSRIEVSSLTTPDNDLAKKAAQNPKSLTPAEYEVWYCTAYVSAICYQIQEVLPDCVAKPIRQVAESEGTILQKTQLLMTLITILGSIGSALGISNLVTANVMERSQELGLLKAIGANNASIVRLILTEMTLTGIIGGILGYFTGLGFAQIIGKTVFGSYIDIAVSVIPIIITLVFLVTILGSIPAINYLMKLKPTEVLHGK